MVSNVKLVWITPDAEKHLAYIARVSNPDNQENPNYEKLFKYMMDHGHWSPFEMASACFEINTTRDIARQILRHRSFSFQEFSQRYQDTTKLEYVAPKEARLQDTNNRQNSISTDDNALQEWWVNEQAFIEVISYQLYENALRKGIAKECARVVLPEGLTPSRLYMSGTIRSWIHYLKSRTDPSTQKEHRLIAEQIKEILAVELPTVFK